MVGIARGPVVGGVGEGGRGLEVGGVMLAVGVEVGRLASATAEAGGGGGGGMVVG